MQRLLELAIRIFIFLLLCAAMAGAQVPLPVTGNLSQILGVPSPYATVSIQLQNCPAPVTIPGTAILVQTQMEIMSNASGVVNGQVWPVDLIDCNGTTGNAQYATQYIVAGVPSANPVCYAPTSSLGVWNLQTLQPTVCGQTPPAPGDETYNNLVIIGFLTAVNAHFTGNVAVDGVLTLGHPPGTCGAGQFITGIDATLTKTCSAPASSPVSSVFGRSGAVLAQTGDYSYAQISGTPPTTATLASNPNLVNAVTAGTNGQPACWNAQGGVGNCTRAQIALGTVAIPATTCTTPATQALTGVRSTSTFATSFASDPRAVTGWGAVGGLVVELWPDASNDVFDWSVCNQTTSPITPGAMTLNVGVH